MIATSVSFKGNDLEDAEKIEAGMHETKEELQKQNEELKTQNEAFQQQQAQLAVHQEKIAANKAAVVAVTNVLIQQGHIPLTRMLAPGAMGEAHQVGDDKTEQGQAENRRVVGRLLQNKGVAGI